MKDLTCCPSTLAPGFDTYCPAAIKRLFGGVRTSHVMAFNYDDDQYAAVVDNTTQISVSGAQEKLSAIAEGGQVRLTEKGEQGQFIIKPAPDNRALRDRQQIPANEHLTMQIARQVFHIPTAENGMIFFADGTPAYLTQRFDLNEDGSKIPQEDFSALTGRTAETHGRDFKYSGCYSDIAKAIREYVAAWPVEMGKFFTLVVFNYVFSNGDAHLKNFSLQKSKDGDYLLTPAYDLLNTSLHIDDSDFALEGGLSVSLEISDVYDLKGHPCQEDFMNWGKEIGLAEKTIGRLLTPFLSEQPKVLELIGHSFLEEKQKRMYLSSYRERLSRLQRKSKS